MSVRPTFIYRGFNREGVQEVVQKGIQKRIQESFKRAMINRKFN